MRVNMRQSVAFVALSVLLAGIATFAKHRSQPTVKRGLVAIPQLLNLKASSSDGRLHQERIWIANESSNPIRVERVLTTCSCIVARSIEGVEIGPKCRIPVDIDVRFPEAGELQHTLTIVNNGPEVRLSVAVRLNGCKDAPFVRRQDGLPLAFDGKEFANEKCFEIATVEADGAADWLCEFTCTDANVVVSSSRAARSHFAVGAGVDQRTYKVRVRPSATSKGAEVAGFVLAKTRDNKVLNLGTVTGIRSPHRLSPSRVIFRNQTMQQSEILLFVAEDRNEKWALDSAKPLPAWLRVELQVGRAVVTSIDRPPNHRKTEKVVFVAPNGLDKLSCDIRWE